MRRIALNDRLAQEKQRTKAFPLGGRWQPERADG